MNFLSDSAYYIWWLKNHHASISLTQIEQEVDALVAEFNRRNSRDMLEDFYFSYLRDLQAFGYNIHEYERYCADMDKYYADLLELEYEIDPRDWGLSGHTELSMLKSW